MKLTTLLVCLVASLACAARVRAFSDPEKFKVSALEGGGGGRFFTGSPADGYTCTVCHRGGTAPKVSIRGLPIDSYNPGATYDVEVTWDNPAKSHALVLELTTPNGLSAGSVELVEEEQLDARSYCDQDVTLSLAAYLTEVAGRRIIGVSDCGAAVLRFRFTAPDEPRVAFSLSMVASDQEGDSRGDAALDLTHTLARFGERPKEVVGTSSACTTHENASSDLMTPLLVTLLLAARARGTRRARQSD